MNTDFTVFEPPKTPPSPAPSPSPAAPVAPQPQVVVVQTNTRASLLAAIALAVSMLTAGCEVGNALGWRPIIPIPFPTPHPSPAPGPSPAPTPRPTPPPAPVVDAYTGPLCVSLVYDPTSQADNTATVAIRKDATLPGRLASDQVSWYVLSPDEAASLNWTGKSGWRTPTIVIQKPSDPGNLSFNPVPASSDDLVALIAKYRGK